MIGTTFDVKGAAYGAPEKENVMRALDATKALQKALHDSPNGAVNINNQTMGGDPWPGHPKEFGAIVEVNGDRRAFACKEGETIDFS